MRLLFGQGSPSPTAATPSSKTIQPKIARIQQERNEYDKILTALAKDQLALGNKSRYDSKAGAIYNQRQALITKIEARQSSLMGDIRSTVSGFAKQLAGSSSPKKP